MMRYATAPEKMVMKTELRMEDAAPVKAVGVAVANGTL